MQDLVVLSGKGGTGKTTIVGALAALWKNLILVDCDVDASNLHLITRPDIKEEHSFTATRKAVIDPALCTGCDICVDFCRFGAIHRDPGLISEGDAGYRIEQLSCEGCGLCTHICPVAAIEMQTVETGKWYLSETPFGPLVHGRLAPAQGNSGRLVALLRSEASEVAAGGGFALTLVDGPPGISCPTIASVTGAAYALIVTEPSESAFHDLRRVVDLTRHFRVPTGICINKSDINPEISSRIEDFARERGLKALGRLIYERSVTKAQIERQTIVEFAENALTSQVRSLHERLSEELDRVRAGRRIETD